MRTNIKLKKPVLDIELDVDEIDLEANGYYIPKWIPCSERLPEEDGEYLVTVKWCNSREVFQDTFWGKGMWDDFNNEDVLAWMPLPKPWNKETIGTWSEDIVPSTMGYVRYKCSECGEFAESKTKYCGHCGARMVDDETD